MPRYGSKRAPAVSAASAHTSSIQFGDGVSTHKPTASKSAGTLGKWGVTSFTSIRSSIVNGSSRSMSESSSQEEPKSPSSGAPVETADPFSFQSSTPTAPSQPQPKVKKFFKSRNAAAAPVAVAAAAVVEQRRQQKQPFYRGRHSRSDRSAAAAHTPSAIDPVDMYGSNIDDLDSKRFFSSPANVLPLRDSSTRENQNSTQDLAELRLPPLKLKISRDKDTGDLTAVSNSPASPSAPDQLHTAPAAPLHPAPLRSVPVQRGGVKKRRAVGRPPAHSQPKTSRRVSRSSPPPLLRAPLTADDGTTEGPVRRSRRAAAAEARERVAKTVRYSEQDDDDRDIYTSTAGVQDPSLPPQLTPTVLSPVDLHQQQLSPQLPVLSPSVADGSDSTLMSNTAPAGTATTATDNVPTSPIVKTPESASPIDPAPAPAAAIDPTPTAPTPAVQQQPVEDALESQLSSLFSEDDSTECAASGTKSTECAATVSNTGLKDSGISSSNVDHDNTESKVYTKGVKDLCRYERFRDSSDVSAPKYQQLESALQLLDSGLADATSIVQPEASIPALTRAATEPAIMKHDSCLTSTVTEAATTTSNQTSSTRAAGPAECRKPGSIFKSRAARGDRQTRATYKHTWTENIKPGGATVAPQTSVNSAAAKTNDTPGVSSPLDFSEAGASPVPVGASPVPVGASSEVNPRLTRVNTWHGTDPDCTGEIVTSVKCNRNAKEYYTLIKNVKKAYEVQELGEFQEYNDDVEYIMDALQPTNSTTTRCLSTMRLAGKCVVPAFRMHVRAQGTVVRFFSALRDAPRDPALSLCTAAVMYVLSQDQLNMDLDRASLELMLSLLDSDSSTQRLDSSAANELEKQKTKVRELCAQLQRQGHAKNIQLEGISAGYLSMETLLSLTSERAGAWFKEELRTLGGVDHLMRTISECYSSLQQSFSAGGDDADTSLLVRKVERCLRVVENVTCRNEENQLYLVQCNAVSTLSSLFLLCRTRLQSACNTAFLDADSGTRALLSATQTLLKVLVNLSHDPSTIRSAVTMATGPSPGALLGQQTGFIGGVLCVVLQLVPSIPDQLQFQLWLLCCYLLINLTEKQDSNRAALMVTVVPVDDSSDDSAVSQLVVLFRRLVALASEVEDNTDRMLETGQLPASESIARGDGAASGGGSGNQPADIDVASLTASALIQKAGHHMEKTVIAAYIGVLIGQLCIDNKSREADIRQYLDDGRFDNIIDVMTKLLNFLDLTKTGRADSQEMKIVRRVIDFMKRADNPPIIEPSIDTDASFPAALDMSL